ncbi:sugar-transfer associated ATP-grasp domain-containing protein [uncultured Alistipes sp.]|uniref:sugar-transfer associated ATP-grasp domain-containing protein n=1 Tax=uncultured Alistipes sp. TaxID=538949 RepID=UPI003208731F
MKLSIKQLIKSNYLGKQIYWYYRLKRDSKIVFKNFGIRANFAVEFKKIRAAHSLFGWLPDEFYLYHYESLSNAERQAFICEDEHVVVADFLNTAEARTILGDKWNTYKEFCTFFDRKACCITNKPQEKEEWDTLYDLFDTYGKLIIKPLDGSFGKGIQIVECTSDKKSLKQRLQTYYPKGFIAEEIIKQDERMAVLHEKSVNTLRIHTICFDGDVTIFHPYIRIGRKNNIVDNAGSGGVFTSCDPETGEILTVVDEFGNTYTNHPDTGFPLVGFKVPCWNKAFQTAKELALHNPNIHYAGWDLALTKGTWVLIEGNPRAQFLFQISEQKGFRQEFHNILNKYGKVYKTRY